jgi:hypothetical protein
VDKKEETASRIFQGVLLSTSTTRKVSCRVDCKLVEVKRMRRTTFGALPFAGKANVSGGINIAH